jgi:hypothetical protein
MEVAFGFILLVLGFAMLLGGVGLLIGGDITFKSGKKIPKPAGRKAGIALASFLPLALLAIFILRKTVEDQTIPSAAVTWPLAVLCLGLAARWVLRGMVGAKPKRSYVLPASPSPFEPSGATSEPVMLEFDIPPPSADPPVGKPVRSKSGGKSPFDFS